MINQNYNTSKQRDLRKWHQSAAGMRKMRGWRMSEYPKCIFFNKGACRLGRMTQTVK